MQIIQHGSYERAAAAGQFKQYEIPAERGVIEAYDGSNIVPIVLNEDTYTLFADPKFIPNPREVSEKIAPLSDGSIDDYEEKMKQETRYAVLAKKLNKSQKEQIEKLEIKGVGLRTESIRTYPQGALAAQVLGFVNDEGKGTSGIEQFLDTELRGKSGELKAITDVRGVPLVSNQDNIRREPVAGERVRLTLDISMQRKVEDLLRDHVSEVQAASGSVIVMDPYTGAVKAMANFPTYNPAEFFKETDAKVFNNAAVSSPLEVGSIMKVFTVASGINQKIIAPGTTFQDPASYKIDGATIRNVEESGAAQTRSVQDILRYSLNTGATWVLMQMGGGELNEKGRVLWHSYMTDNYRFGQKTGIEQGYEEGGMVPKPTDGFGLNIQYANTTFGQGVLTTPIQMAAGLSAVINGGTYYRPRLVEGEPQVLRTGAVSQETSNQIRAMLEYDVENGYRSLKRPGYRIGGKTGTAQISNPAGGYFEDRVNGTFIGFIGGDRPEYVIMVRIDEPHVAGYAGIAAAAPLFNKVSGMLIDNFSISPASQ